MEFGAKGVKAQKGNFLWPTYLLSLADPFRVTQFFLRNFSDDMKLKL